jgi:hypothetical protein
MNVRTNAGKAERADFRNVLCSKGSVVDGGLCSETIRMRFPILAEAGSNDKTQFISDRCSFLEHVDNSNSVR